MDWVAALINLAMPSGITVIAVLVLLVVLLDEERAPARVLGPAPGGGWRPFGGRGMPPVYWHARMGSIEDLLHARFGILCLVDGQAWFVADFPDAGSQWRPEYVGAIAGSHVQRRPLLSVRRGDVDWWVNGHRLRIVVGRTRLNRIVANDVKNLASRADAHTFVSMLMANGARLGPPPHLRELR